jgi:hypothetical protein
MEDLALSDGDVELLVAGLDDDIALVWVLIHLGIRTNPPTTPDWRPCNNQLAEAFRALDRLLGLGLIEIGRIEYIDEGPPGRVAPVRHVREDQAVVRSRVEDAVASAQSDQDWAYSCWVVNTVAGNAVARQFVGH